jgi:phosphopantothenoylcysteine synthetase/decarboxylase
MKKRKKLGIWMDHSIAHLMEFTNKHFEIKTIESKLKNDEKPENLFEPESIIHNKKGGLLLDYYKKLSEAIKDYEQVILFGPTNAKIEFFDVISEDIRFLKIKFEIKNTDKMTQNQQHEFVQQYFSEA